MKKIKFIVVLTVLTVVVTGLLCTPAKAQIEPYYGNNAYWQYNGEPVVLIGGSDHDSIFQWMSSTLRSHLNLLKSSGGNYIRNTMSSRSWNETTGYNILGYPQPFKKLSDGRYDLAQWNSTYWNKLTTFLNETKNRGIIVQLEIWDATTINSDSEWSVSPWNPNNNVNYTTQNTQLNETNSDGFFNAIPPINNDTVVYNFQKRYIEKILRIALQYNHVLYQIDNESSFDYETSNHWADFIHNYASKTVYVAESRLYHSPSYTSTNFKLNHPENTNSINNPTRFNYLDISQNGGNSGQTHYDNLIWYRGKVRNKEIRPINHTKTYRMNFGTGQSWNSRSEATDAEGTAKLWRTIFGGAASVRFHRYNTRTPRPGIGLTPLGQRHIKSMSLFLGAINIFEMVPDNGVLSSRTSNEAYALVEAGNQYAVYFTGTSDRTVGLNLNSYSGTFTLEWLNVGTGAWQTAPSIAGGRTITLKTPQTGQWVAVLTASGGPPPPPPSPTPTPTSGDNILQNGNFDQGQTAWTNLGTDRTLLSNSSQCRGGSGNCLKITGSQYRHVDHVSLAVSPNTSYTVSGYLKVANRTSGGIKIYIEWLNGSTPVGNIVSLDSQSSNTSGYVLKTKTVTSPSNAKSMQLFCIKEGTNAAFSGYFDDVTVVSGSAEPPVSVSDKPLPPPPPPPSPTPTPTSGDNILQNGNFDQGQTAWTNLGTDRTLLSNSSQCRGGSGNCLKITGSQYRHVDHVSFAVSPNTSYTVSGYLKVANRTSGGIKIYIKWLNGSTPVGNIVSLDSQSSNTSGYVLKTKTVTSPSNAKSMQLFCIKEGTNAAFSGYFDDVTVVSGSAEPPVSVSDKPLPPPPPPPSPTPTPTPTSGDNILQNGNFDQGQTAWTNLGTDRTLLSNSSQCRGGSGNCLKITGSQYRHVDHVSFAVSPNTSYTVSGYLKVANRTSGGIKIYIKWLNGSTPVGNIVSLESQSSNTSGYVLKTKTVTSPSNAKSMQLFCIKEGTNAAFSGYFDDVTVVSGSAEPPVSVSDKPLPPPPPPPSPTPTPTSGDNILQNGNFDQGQTAWTNLGTDRTLLSNSSQCRGGSGNCLKITGSQYRHVDHVSLAVSPNTSYTVSGYLKVANRTSGGIKIYIKWLNGSTPVGNIVSLESQSSNTSGYVLKTKTMTSPANAKSMQLFCIKEGTNAAFSGYFDDVTVVSGSAEPPPSSSPPLPSPPPPGDNILQNGNFEQGQTAWTNLGTDRTLLSNSSQCRGGNGNCLKITGSQYRHVDHVSFAVSPNTSYTVSGYLKVANRTSGGIKIYIEWLNGSTPVGNIVSLESQSSNTSGYVLKTKTMTSPSNAKSMRLFCIKEGTNAAFSGYFDDVTVVN